MSDRKIIYLDEAIDAMCDACLDWCDEGVCKKVSAIQKLPSAQPEPIKINTEDFNKEDWERLKKEWGNTPITVLSAQPDLNTSLYTDGFTDGYKRAQMDAQEIIRCKDCLMHGVCRFEQGLGLDGYCSQAERREE